MSPSVVDSLFTPAAKNRLLEMGNVRLPGQDGIDSEKSAAQFLKGCTVAIGSWGTPEPTLTLCGQLPELKIWIHAAGSVKKFFSEGYAGANLKVISCHHSIAEAVAELTLAYLVMGLRRAMTNMEQNRTGPVPAPKNRFLLAESTVGVVGASSVGRSVIRRLPGICRRILVYDPFLSESEATRMGAVKMESLVEMATECQALTLHTPLLPGTKNLINASVLSALPAGSVFVNTSRGGCVDHEALLEKVESNDLHAFLDVTEPPKLSVDHPLRSHPRIHLSSHIAGGHHSTLMGDEILDSLDALQRGLTPPGLAIAQKLATSA